MNKYESELLGSLHETAVGLHKIGVINDKEMREYDRDCLVSDPKSSFEGKSASINKPIPAFASSGS
jgi:DNA-binding transcriptional regulator YiaG